ncbi:hypothetical protein GFS60_08185 (plasmid) [Rhodococcus sp. WAY2]|nr:hypothetical protein GFS60_08185 [Rhodococcus sp. WAY2]
MAERAARARFTDKKEDQLSQDNRPCDTAMPVRQSPMSRLSETDAATKL